MTSPQDGDQKPGEAERERFGGLTDRIPAAFVDVVLSNLSFLGVLSVSGGRSSPFAFAIAVIVVFGGLITMTAVLGFTPGKFFYKLRITNADATTTPPSWAAATGRTVTNLIGLIPVVGIVFQVLNIILIYVDDERRSLFDRVGRTRIVKTSELPT